MKKFRYSIFFDIILTILVLTISTFLGVLFRKLELHETNIVVIYIFSVLLVSRFTKGYAFGIASSVISLLLFNWFFTEPYYTLKVNDMTYFITFAIMTLTSIFTSTLTTKVKKAASDAKEREKESNSLYQMTNFLTDAEGTDAISEIIARTTSNVLNCGTAFICFDEEENPKKTFIQCKEDGQIVRRDLQNGQELKKRMSLLHDSVDITEEHYLYPVYGKDKILAVLRIPSYMGEVMTSSQTRMLYSIIENAALALDRYQSIQEQLKSREETTQERYRANLLRAISHDIRTPLSGIIGTSEILMSKTDPEDDRYGLAKDIYCDAEWLHGLVENILNLTRLRDGKLVLNKKLEAVEEVIGASLMVIDKRSPNSIINIEMPDNVVMAPMDARLVTQVLVNLLDNAVKHTLNNEEITISVIPNNDNVSIKVSDRGTGIPEKDLSLIFQMFYTTNNRRPDSKRGVGLGLAICQSIVEAHGGTIFAKNREGGGAEFTFTLPLGGENNE